MDIKRVKKRTIAPRPTPVPVSGDTHHGEEAAAAPQQTHAKTDDNKPVGIIIIAIVVAMLLASVAILAYLKTNTKARQAKGNTTSPVSSSVQPKKVTTVPTLQSVESVIRSIDQAQQTIGNGQDFSANNDLSNNNLGL